jgi:hypothetical protein
LRPDLVRSHLRLLCGNIPPQAAFGVQLGGITLPPVFPDAKYFSLPFLQSHRPSDPGRKNSPAADKEHGLCDLNISDRARKGRQSVAHGVSRRK